MSRIAFASLGLLLILVPQAAAHQTVSGTSSTGNVDTWGLITGRLPQCDAVPDLNVAMSSSDPTQADLSGAIGRIPPTDTGCLLEPCPMDIYWFTVTLTLLDASPGDAVSLSVDRLAGPGPMDLSELFTSSYEFDPSNPLPGTPNPHRGTDVATYDDPVAQVVVQLGGCDRQETAIVTGLLVDGEVDYELTY